MGHRIQRLRRRVTHRVNSTIRGIRAKSIQYAGFPTRPDANGIDVNTGAAASAADDSKLKHMQLHNTIVRALLVVPVTYEPSRLLRRSKDAVLVVTGADLVIVKMCKMVATNVAASESQGSQSFPSRHSSTGDTNAAEEAEQWDADLGAASAADLAQATVLAQHELNKMIKCCVSGKQLELEFIVTGGARFKVTTGALGFSSSSSKDPEPVDTPQPSGKVEGTEHTGSAPDAMLTPVEGKCNTQSPQQADTTVSTTADTASSAAQSGVQSAVATSAYTCVDTNVNGIMHRAAQQQQNAATSLAGSSNPALELHARGSKHTPSVSWQAEDNSSMACESTASSTRAAGALKQGIGRSASYVRRVGSSVAAYVPSFEDASRTVSGSIRNFRLVNTDEGSYWVYVESFALQFRDALTCELAADLLQSGRANMRAAVEWLKQGVPFKPDFSVTHITELTSRTGPESLVSGPISWGTDLQLPGSWVAAISTAQLPQEQPLLTPIQVTDGPAAFRIHLATPSGLAQATVVPELLALLAQHPHPRGQLLAVPINLQPAQCVTVDRQQKEQRLQRELHLQEGQQELLQLDREQAESSTETALLPCPLLTDTSQLRQQQCIACDAAPTTPEQQQREELHVPKMVGSPVGSSEQLEVAEDDADLEGDDSELVESFSTYQTAVGDTESSVASVHLTKQPPGSQAQYLPVMPVPPARLTPTTVALRAPMLAAEDTNLSGDTSVDSLSVSSSKLRRMLSMPSRSYTFTKTVARSLLSRMSTSRGDSLRSLSPRSPSRSSIIRAVGSPVAALGVSVASSTLRRLGFRRSCDGDVDRPSKRVFRRSKSQPARLSSFRATSDLTGSDSLKDPAEDIDGHALASRQVTRFRRAASSEDLLLLQQQGSCEQSEQSSAGAMRRQPRFIRQQASFHRQSAPDSCYSSTEGSSGHSFMQPFGAGDQPQQRHAALQTEIYAALHVQLVSGSSTKCSSVAVYSNSSSGHVATAGTYAETTDTPTVVAAGSGMQDGQQPDLGLVNGRVCLGNTHTEARQQLTLRQQRLLSLIGVAAACLCVLAFLYHNPSGMVLGVFAVCVNTACMLLTAHPGRLPGSSQCLTQQLRFDVNPACSKHTRQLLSDKRTEHSAERTQMPAARDDLATSISTAAAVAAVASSDQQSGGLRLRLMGASFVRDPLGMLQEQISSWRILQERAYAELAGDSSEGLPDDSGVGAVAAEDADGLSSASLQLSGLDDVDCLMLISKPEPSWLTADWRRRILAARSTTDERRKLAGYVHSWRLQYHADTLLLKQLPHFEWFQKHMFLKPLIVTPQGHVVLLLKMASLVQLSRNLAAAALTVHDFTAYCGLIWSYMFDVLAPGSHPSGRLIMVSDMKDVKLGQAVGEGQVGARALGAVCNAWPERLVTCLVLGTPSWFNMLYRLVRPHLSPSTSAKIQICDAVEGAAELALWLGHDMVPREYEGTCTLHYDDYPAQKQLLEYVRQLPRN